MAYRFAQNVAKFQSTLPARGSDGWDADETRLYSEFQSTLPARGSDYLSRAKARARLISIHAPRKGERQQTKDNKDKDKDISIHAPRKGERQIPHGCRRAERRFQSTLPARGSDICRLKLAKLPSRFQSTLPARGSDRCRDLHPANPNNFNPRSPQGGATWCCGILIVPSGFQSTLPARGSDHRKKSIYFIERISIHAPRKGERLRRGCLSSISRWYFNPRSPQGGATYLSTDDPVLMPDFNPRSPQGGATRFACRCVLQHRHISIHAPRKGERPRLPKSMARAGHFNPRSPQGGATAEKCICMQHFREFAEYYPLRHGDARCIAPQDCIIQAFFGAKKRCFYVRLCFALKNKGVRG